MLARVWAPLAAAAEIRTDGRGVPLVSEGDSGWWSAEVPGLVHGARYDLEVDGGVVRPDPLARRLPDGVHGAAQVWDPASYDWDDTGWTGRDLADRALVYELHVGTFTPQGTLLAAAQRLGHLVDLGVTHVELMPLAAFDGERGWGYDGVAMATVHEAYGGPDALCDFVGAAHRHGLAVLLDLVQNHLGPSGNSWSALGPLVDDRYETPWGGAVNLDGPHSDQVREILLSTALAWLRDFHLDGLRLDAVHELHDERARHYLQELAAAVASLSAEVGRPLALVAESDRNDPRTVEPLSRNGFGMTAQWDDDVHHALHWLLTGEDHGYYADFASCAAVAHALERAFLHDGRWSSFRGRTHGAAVDWAHTDPWRFVVALQTHDQVGNRAEGERLAALVDVDRLAAGAALLLTLPYTPLLFMGEEWGASTPWPFFTSFRDPELGAAVTAGRRDEFSRHGWERSSVPDPQDPATQRGAVLRWAELGEPDHARLLDWYRTLVGLRAGRPVPSRSTGGSGVRCRWSAGTDGRPTWFAVAAEGIRTVVNLGGGDLELRSRGMDAGWGEVAVEQGVLRLARGAVVVTHDTPDLFDY